MASVKCIEVFVCPFQSEARGKVIPKDIVATYAELVSNACVVYDKTAADSTVEFFRNKEDHDSEITAALWDAGAFFKLAEGSALKIWVRFSESAIENDNQPAPPPRHSPPKRPLSPPGEAARKRARTLKRASFMSASDSSSTGSTTSHTRSTPPTSSDGRNDGLSDEAGNRETQREPETSLPTNPREESELHDLSADSNIDVVGSVSSNHGHGHTACHHPRPPKPNGETGLILRFKAETKGMFQKWKDFDGTDGTTKLDLDDSYDDVRDKITRRMYNAVGSGQVTMLKKYREQIHYEVCLGTRNGGVFRMQRPLRIMDYVPRGEEPIGHIHVWLEKDGRYFEDIAFTVTDAEYAGNIKPATPHKVNSARRFKLCPPLAMTPGPDCASTFCSDPVTLEIRFKSNTNPATRCEKVEPLFTGRKLYQEHPGNLSSRQVREVITEDVVKLMRKENIDPTGIWIDFGLFFQDDTNLKTIMTFEDPRQTLHQFLTKQGGAPRRLLGNVYFKQRKRVKCCNGFEDPVLLGCDGKKCKTKWFHLRCTGFEEVPKVLYWFCKDCKARQPRSDDISGDPSLEDLYSFC